MNIEIDKNSLCTYSNEYVTNKQQKLTEDEIASINSIFDDCDEDGNGKLTDGEVPKFNEKVRTILVDMKNHLTKAGKVVMQYLYDLAAQNKVEKVDLKLTEEQKNEYDKLLDEAKQIISDNKGLFNLTDEEIQYIANAKIESREHGYGEYDRNADAIIFNYNGAVDSDNNFIKPNKGSLVKILIHEATHASKKSYDSQTEERECETRGLSAAIKLMNEGKIDDFEILQGSEVKLSDLKEEGKLNEFISQWINMCGYDKLPEE